MSCPPHVRLLRCCSVISKKVDNDSSRIGLGYDSNPNIDYYHTGAKFVSNKVIQVGDEKITADKIFIAVGARPQIPAIDGLDGTPYMTSTEALRRTSFPKSMIVKLFPVKYDLKPSSKILEVFSQVDNSASLKFPSEPILYPGTKRNRK